MTGTGSDLFYITAVVFEDFFFKPKNFYKMFVMPVMDIGIDYPVNAFGT